MPPQKRPDSTGWLVWAGLMAGGAVIGGCSGCASEWIWPFKYGEMGEGAVVLFLEALARTAGAGLVGMLGGALLAWLLRRGQNR
jgi:hypothetical protein